MQTPDASTLPAWENRDESPVYECRIGQRVGVFGGYSQETGWRWLVNNRFERSRVIGFPSSTTMTIEFEQQVHVKLDSDGKSVRGRYAVLEQRYDNAQWVDGTIVGVRISTSLPQHAKDGVMVESHAELTLLAER